MNIEYKDQSKVNSGCTVEEILNPIGHVNLADLSKQDIKALSHLIAKAEYLGIPVGDETLTDFELDTLEQVL